MTPALSRCTSETQLSTRKYTNITGNGLPSMNCTAACPAEQAGNVSREAHVWTLSGEASAYRIPNLRDKSEYLEVVIGYVVVVGLHLTESFLVVLHQVIDVKVFSLLDLVNVHLCRQAIWTGKPTTQCAQRPSSRQKKLQSRVKRNPNS